MDDKIMSISTCKWSNTILPEYVMESYACMSQSDLKVIILEVFPYKNMEECKIEVPDKIRIKIRYVKICSIHQVH
jgi:hypothetical protein